MKLVDRRVFIDAPPARVYELLTDTGLLVELTPYRRIVFTYGWDRDDVGIPPGSTTTLASRSYGRLR